jgi:hypothetical protein
MDTNIIKCQKDIKKYKSFLASKFSSYFYGKDEIYSQLEELYEKILQAYIVTMKYREYYETINEYNNILEEYYKYKYENIIKKTQLNNIKKLIDMNIFDKIDGRYPELLNSYEKYAEECGDIDIYSQAINTIIKLYIQDEIKYDCNIINFLEKYNNLKNTPHKEHGMILCKKSQYNNAINIFQQYLDTNINHHVLKYCVGSNVYMLMLCYMLVNDEVATKNKYDRIKNDYPTLENNYEFKFIIRIVDAYLEKDIESFSQVIAEQDKMKRLDDIMVDMLLKIKRQISNDDDLC